MASDENGPERIYNPHDLVGTSRPSRSPYRDGGFGHNTTVAGYNPLPAVIATAIDAMRRLIFRIEQVGHEGHRVLTPDEIQEIAHAQATIQQLRKEYS